MLPAARPPRLYIVAGEASGDMHAARLMQAFAQLHPGAQWRGTGGEKMAAQGAELLFDIAQMNFMGFAEVLSNLPTILKLMRSIRRDCLAWKPDMVVLVDYPGMNLRLAKAFHRAGIKVVYYISPQLWAWNQGRAAIVRRYVDLMLCILPFEPAFYARFGVQARYVGHPLLDSMPQDTLALNLPQAHGRPLLAVLPGSRPSEVSRMLPVMLEAAEALPQFQPVLAAAPGLPRSYYEPWLKGGQVALVSGQTYALLQQARLAMVCSGTATLETALLGCPQVVGYKGSWLSFQIARRLVKVPYISLVNLILDKPLLRELIQHQCTPQAMAQELLRLNLPEVRAQVADEYANLRQLLGNRGASAVAAQALADVLGQ